MEKLLIFGLYGGGFALAGFVLLWASFATLARRTIRALCIVAFILLLAQSALWLWAIGISAVVSRDSPIPWFCGIGFAFVAAGVWSYFLWQIPDRPK